MILRQLLLSIPAKHSRCHVPRHFTDIASAVTLIIVYHHVLVVSQDIYTLALHVSHFAVCCPLY